MNTMYKTKVVINGCFDLLHKGHIYLIELALKHSYCGEVLVLVNSNQSARELKGENRPYEDVVNRGHNIEGCLSVVPKELRVS